MIKKILSLLLVLIFCFALSGCWNFVMLNEITLVAGMAVDMDEKGEKYKLTCEVVKIRSSLKNEPASGSIIETEGKTIFDAIRRAGKNLTHKLYFSHMAVVIVDKEIAKDEGLPKIVDWLNQDAEPRETIYLLISKADSAAEILKTTEETDDIVSYNIRDALKNTNKYSGSTADTQVFQAFNILNSEGQSLVLPAIKILETDGKKKPHIEGMAAFNKKAMAGFLDPQTSHCLNITRNKLKGGVFTLDLEDDGIHDVSLEIQKTKSKLKYKFENDQVHITVEPSMFVFINELNVDIDLLNPKNVSELQTNMEEKMSEEIENALEQVQRVIGSDVIGVGKAIYQKQPKLWKELKDNWDEYFKNMTIEVKAKINIINSSLSK